MAFLQNLKTKQELLITAKHETSPLPTYPIKNAFLLETQKYPDDADWRGFKLAERTFSILDTMQKGTSDGSLTGAILIKEPVFIQPDRCYVEARNLLQFLHLVNWILKWISYVNWFMIFISVPPHVTMLYILYSVLFLSQDILNDQQSFINIFLFYLVWIIGNFLLYVFYFLVHIWALILSKETSMKYMYQLYRSFNFLIIVLLLAHLGLVVNLSYIIYHVIDLILNRSYCLTDEILKRTKNIYLFIPGFTMYVIIVLVFHCLYCLKHSKFNLKQWLSETALPDFLYGMDPPNKMYNFKLACLFSMIAIVSSFFVVRGVVMFFHMYLVQPNNFNMLQVCDDRNKY